MVRIIVENNLVAAPVPVADIANVHRRNAEVEAVEPEPLRTAAYQSPHMVRPEAAGEMTVLPWMVQVEARIVVAHVVAHPRLTAIHMRRLRMTRLIVEVMLRLVCRRTTMTTFVHPCRTMARRLRVEVAVTTAPLLVTMLLSESGRQRCRKRESRQFPSHTH